MISSIRWDGDKIELLDSLGQVIGTPVVSLDLRIAPGACVAYVRFDTHAVELTGEIILRDGQPVLESKYMAARSGQIETGL